MWQFRQNAWADPKKTEELTRYVTTMGWLSCAEIGRRMGHTKNSIIGRMHRLGLKKPQQVQPLDPMEPYERPALKPVEPKGKTIRPAPLPAPTKPPPSPKPVVPAFEPVREIAPGGVDFIRAERGQCQYPLWPDTQKIGKVCGQPVLHEGCSWCVIHNAIVYARPVMGRPRRHG
jgi:GcrA cell cycle regulator